MIWAKFGWNWPSSSGEEDFFVFLHFRYYLPLEMTNGHHMNKSESPSLKDDLDQVWLKYNVFLHFRYYLPLEMTDGHHLNKSESPSPKDDLG